MLLVCVYILNLFEKDGKFGNSILCNFLLSDLRRILPVINLKMEIYLMILTYTHSKIFKDTLSAGAPIIRKPIFILNYQVFF